MFIVHAVNQWNVGTKCSDTNEKKKRNNLIHLLLLIVHHLHNLHKKAFWTCVLKTSKKWQKKSLRSPKDENFLKNNFHFSPEKWRFPRENIAWLRSQKYQKKRRKNGLIRECVLLYIGNRYIYSNTNLRTNINCLSLPVPVFQLLLTHVLVFHDLF